MLASAQQGRAAGAVILRGGAWKPRSSSYACQGVGRPGLKLLARAREESGLLVCTEAMDPEGVRWVSEVADIVQIGARNMQNYSLLKVAARRGQPRPHPRRLSARLPAVLPSCAGPLRRGDRHHL